MRPHLCAPALSERQPGLGLASFVGSAASTPEGWATLSLTGYGPGLAGTEVKGGGLSAFAISSRQENTLSSQWAVLFTQGLGL